MPPWTIPNRELEEWNAAFERRAQRIESRSEAAAAASVAG
jgi:hypothetical protein